MRRITFDELPKETMRRITFDELAALGACTNQAALFVSTFGAYEAWHGVRLTEENLRLAESNGLVIKWLLHRLGLCEVVNDDRYRYVKRICGDLELTIAALVAYGRSDEVVKEETPIDEIVEETLIDEIVEEEPLIDN